MYMREQVVRLWQEGKMPVQIMRELVEEDIMTTRHTLQNLKFSNKKKLLVLLKELDVEEVLHQEHH